MKPNRAFTLVELLVVIAILAILAAFLFSVFSRVRAAARQSACLSNLRQIGTAALLYANDHDDGLPTWSEYWYRRSNGIGTADSWGDDGPQQRWGLKVAPYSGTRNPYAGAWRCPNSDSAADGMSYGISQVLLYDTVHSPNRWRYVFYSQASNLARTVLLGDAGADARLALPTNLDGYYDRFVAPQPVFHRESPWRHGDGANYAMLDGHVRRIPARDAYPNPRDLGVSIVLAKGHANCATARLFALDAAQAEHHARLAEATLGSPCPDVAR
ncbi:MAG: prepilin-type N-terminal cleavage/methylation domain-containing protein [Fimbriimonadaceae bacterium]